MSVRKEQLAEGITLLCGDCRELLPTLPIADLMLTDPPYGIKMDRGVGGGGYGFGRGVKRQPKAYAGDWDKERPDGACFDALLAAAKHHIIWGGNYFADSLPVSGKWLWWDKLQTMPSFSDGELAWTSLQGNATKKFVYNGSGLMAREKLREHPTQKPIALMEWCLGFSPQSELIVDPFLGSGSTGVACARLGRQFTGIELNVGYFDIACRRIAEELRRPRLFAEPVAKLVQGMFNV